jgi:ankyrin repeat protein
MFNLGKRWKLIMVYIFAVIFSLSGFALAEPIQDAAKEGDLAKVKSLIAEGSDVNVKDEKGSTPLHFAAYLGYKDVAELLILKGANVNAADKTGAIPLHFAARRGHKDLVELLILKGANVNEMLLTIESGLHWAGLFIGAKKI